MHARERNLMEEKAICNKEKYLKLVLLVVLVTAVFSVLINAYIFSAEYMTEPDDNIDQELYEQEKMIWTAYLNDDFYIEAYPGVSYKEEEAFSLGNFGVVNIGKPIREEAAFVDLPYKERISVIKPTLDYKPIKNHTVVYIHESYPNKEYITCKGVFGYPYLLRKTNVLLAKLNYSKISKVELENKGNYTNINEEAYSDLRTFLLGYYLNDDFRKEFDTREVLEQAMANMTLNVYFEGEIYGVEYGVVHFLTSGELALSMGNSYTSDENFLAVNLPEHIAKYFYIALSKTEINE